ncbi:MAG TPA: hypothetical protein VG965_02465 [Patescibacteria group bacterium]|nr:hypothetical protein [Patescibacteria group bacterium]
MANKIFRTVRGFWFTLPFWIIIILDIFGIIPFKIFNVIIWPAIGVCFVIGVISKLLKPPTTTKTGIIASILSEPDNVWLENIFTITGDKHRYKTDSTLATNIPIGTRVRFRNRKWDESFDPVPAKDFEILGEPMTKLDI